MSALVRTASALAVSLLGASLLGAPAQAADCTYTDLHGTFEVKVDCEGLQDHSNLGNEQKRMWLGGAWGQVNIIEVPPPYKQNASDIDLVMSNLGRKYTERRSPGGIQETTVGGQEARVVLEHKLRTSSRSWVFHWQGRNLIMRAVAYGKKRQRMESLDAMSAALTGSFAAATAQAEGPSRTSKEKVRDRKPEAPAPAESVQAESVQAESAPAATAPAATEAVSTEAAAATEAVSTEAAAATEAVSTEAAAATGEAKAESRKTKGKGKKAAADATETADDAETEARKGEDTAEAKAQDEVDKAAEEAEDALEDATKGPKGE